jgi:hypothetical protein
MVHASADLCRVYSRVLASPVLVVQAFSAGRLAGLLKGPGGTFMDSPQCFRKNHVREVITTQLVKQER